MDMDKDLLARQQARNLCREAEKAQHILADFPQEKLDKICEAVSAAFLRHGKELAERAVEETGFGNVQDKTEKNRFAAEDVMARIRGMKTVGVLSKSDGLWEIGIPVGVICGIVPSTNPTSTVCYKSLIAIKSGNPIIFSPHPKAVGCTLRAAELLTEAAEAAGAPKGTIGCLGIPNMAGCNELMTAPEVKLILATGGPGMVKAAYSSGKPAIGVGAGNGPAYIHHSADVKKALSCILHSKTFDNGTVCASEQSIIVEKTMEEQVVQEAQRLGFYFLNKEQAGALSKFLFKPTGGLNPEIVGKTAEFLAQKAGFSVPVGTKILVAREQEAGPTRPYSLEKLCPVLAFFVMDNEDAVLQKAVEVLHHEGSGHTFSFHGTDDAVIARFAAKIPVSRFLVNTPSALGGIGATTKLFPALTLGCGAVGGSSTSDNVSPMNLVNIRRVAWGTKEIPQDTCRVKAEISDDLVEQIAKRIMQRFG